MFNIADYVISMQDVVEIGREKINFLFTGDTSPFNLWSGTPQFLNYESIYRIDENNSNYVSFTTDSSSGSSPFNLIFNGSGNTINSSGTTDFYAGFNLIDGIDNQIINSSGNTLVGSGNTNTGGGIGDGSVFIHGANNNGYFVDSIIPSNNSIISSENVLNRYYYDSTILSSDNSSMTSSGINMLGFGQSNFLSGSFNNIINQYNLNLFGSCFIGNGSGNTIFNSEISTNTNALASIINGHDNLINVDGVNIFNVNLFGSNLTAIDNSYSHFQNLYVDNSMYATNLFSHETPPPIPNATPTSTAVTLNLNYSFQEIINIENPEISIQIPNGGSSIQFLSLCIISYLVTTNNIYFVDYAENFSLGFPTRQTNTPRQIASKQGASTVANGFSNRCVTSLGLSQIVGYFFVWIPMIQKWVMYTSDTSSNATF